MEERRKHKRFTATAFLNMPLTIRPLPPFFGSPQNGKLVDLSGGGMAIAIREIIPQGSKLDLSLTFPDQYLLRSLIEVIRVVPRGKLYVIGLEFLNLPTSMVEKIDAYSNDYMSCEYRIQSNQAEICKRDCSFFSLCSKKQKLPTEADEAILLELAFKELREAELQKPTFTQLPR